MSLPQQGAVKQEAVLQGLTWTEVQITGHTTGLQAEQFAELSEGAAVRQWLEGLGMLSAEAAEWQ